MSSYNMTTLFSCYFPAIKMDNLRLVYLSCLCNAVVCRHREMLLLFSCVCVDPVFLLLFWNEPSGRFLRPRHVQFDLTVRETNNGLSVTVKMTSAASWVVPLTSSFNLNVVRRGEGKTTNSENKKLFVFSLKKYLLFLFWRQTTQKKVFWAHTRKTKS